jgi:hypothetical protein
MTVTHWVLIMTVLGLVIYDLIAASRWGVSETISNQILLLSRRWPIIPFGMGLVMGHFFWSQI